MKSGGIEDLSLFNTHFSIWNVSVFEECQSFSEMDLFMNISKISFENNVSLYTVEKNFYIIKCNYFFVQVKNFANFLASYICL